MSINKLESIMAEVQKLSANEQLQLIKRVADLLAQDQHIAKGRGLVYGKYRDPTGKETTEEDFRLAEWTEERALLHESISVYTAEHAGSDADLDEELEAAAVEHLSGNDEGRSE